MPAADQLPTSGFTKRLEFAGTFERDGIKTQPFSIEVVYSMINGHPPVGIIRGTNKEFDALERFFLKRWESSDYCVIRSISSDRPQIKCTDVRIREIGSKSFTKDERETVHQIIGRFSIGELTIHAKYSDKTVGKRHRVFMLEGPRNLWLSHALRTLSFTGAITSRRINTAFALKGAPDDKLTVAPNFFYADRNRENRGRHKTIQHESFSLAFLDKKKIERDEAAFFGNAATVTETLCLLMGFLSKARMDWSSSVYSDGSVVIETFRDVPAWAGEEPGWEEIVLDSRDIRRFLNTAFTAYEKRIKSGFDLRLPILHYLSAQTAGYAEDRFTVLFFALEKLLSSMDCRHEEDDLLSKTELSNLWKVVRPALTEMGKTPQQMELIELKRNELKRPPLKYRLNRHLSTLGVNLSDIGGDDGLRTMIGVRNKLTHDKDEVPIKKVVFETRRLETIVERMLLKLLGWSGKDQTPTYGNEPIRDED